MPNETTSSVADSSTEHQTIQDQGDAPRKPAGSVELLYCEKCGGLILGGAKNAQPAPNGNGFYCKKCLAAAPAAAVPAVTKGDTAPSLPVAETKEVPRRRPSTAITSVVKRDSSGSGGGNSRSKIMDLPTRLKRQGAQGKDGKDGPDNTKLIAGGAAAAAVVLVLGVLMLGGGSKKETETAKNSATRSDNPAPEPARAEPVRRGPSTVEPPAPKIVLPARSEPLGRPTEPDPIEAARKLEEAERKSDPPAEKPQARPEPQTEKEPTQPEPAKPADPKQVEDAAKAANPVVSKGAAEEEDLAKTKDAPKDPAKAPSNPFSVAEGGGEDPTKVLPGQKPAQPPAAAATPAKPKPLIVKGKSSPIFPADRDSKTVDHQSPAMQQGQKSGIPETKYDGWTFMGRKLDAWNVKSGVLTCDGQLALTLDGFPAKDFEFKFEVELVGGTGLGVMVGSAKEGILLLAVVPTHILPGVWDQTKTSNNVMMDNKAAKPHAWSGDRQAVSKRMKEYWAARRSRHGND